MEQVTIWKSSLEGIMSDLERAGLVCADVAEGINGLANSASDEDPICDRLYSLGRVLGLLRENLDSNYDYLSEWVRNSEKYIARAPRPAGATDTPVLPPLGDFADVPTVDLLRELVRQECIIETAGVEAAIIRQALALRGEPVGEKQQAA